jgi:hypothetical protein
MSVVKFCVHPCACDVLVFDYGGFAKAHFDALRYFDEISGEIRAWSNQCNSLDFVSLFS